MTEEIIENLLSLIKYNKNTIKREAIRMSDLIMGMSEEKSRDWVEAEREAVEREIADIEREEMEISFDNLTPAEKGKLSDEELEMVMRYEDLTPAEKAEIEQILRYR